MKAQADEDARRERENPQQSLLDFLNSAAADTETLRVVAEMMARRDASIATVDNITQLLSVQPSAEMLTSLLITQINGSTLLEQQQVTVEFLRMDQKLVLPSAMGMMWTGAPTGRSTNITALVNRYAKVTAKTYVELMTMLQASTSNANFVERIGAGEETVRTDRFTGWDSEEYYRNAAGNIDAPEARNAAFYIISNALQFNCDIRDFGYLNTPESYVTDDAWKAAASVPTLRLQNKIKPRTMQVIAALNLPACAGYPLGAWVRAYGVGIGVLPSPNSQSLKEFTFTAAHPAQDNWKAVVAYEKACMTPLVNVAANILAMFGLFHLNKDHTFRTGDQNMERIGSSYIQTLRTGVNGPMIDEMEKNKEVVVRTAPHPFGLAQTYWLAQVMAQHEMLMAPLQIRRNTTPPPIQRVMITQACTNEWASMPAGQTINVKFAAEIELVDAMALKIRTTPPAYSSLHYLYGIPNREVIDEATEKAIKAMMGPCYGYIQVSHTEGNEGKDGLGYALSLKNMNAENRGLMSLWVNMWEKYVMHIDEIGIVNFLHGKTKNARTGEIS